MAEIVFESTVLCWPKKLKLHALLHDGCVLCQPEGTAWERTAGGKAFQAVGEKLAETTVAVQKPEKQKSTYLATNQLEKG